MFFNYIRSLPIRVFSSSGFHWQSKLLTTCIFFSDIECYCRINVDDDGPSYTEIVSQYIAKNIPFILTGKACTGDDGNLWSVFDKWIKSSYDENTGHLNVDYLENTYGKLLLSSVHATEGELSSS